MQAMVYDTAGPNAGELRIAELPLPEPGPGEVRVRIHVAAVNPTDWRFRRVGPTTPRWPQQTPGQDGAGIIDQVGAGVDPSRVGQRVWLHLAAYGHPGGSAAEYVCVPARRASPLPEGVSLDVGAVLGVPALTAHRCLFADGPVAGRTVLVTGGGGAVGHAAIQLARHAGARVITTVSGEERAAIAATAGPDVILNYRDHDHSDALWAAAPDGIDQVVDVALDQNLSDYLGLLRPGAVISAYARSSDDASISSPVGPFLRNGLLLRFVYLYAVSLEHLADGVESIDRLLRTDGFLTMPLIRYPLRELAAAHDQVRAGALGKVVVDIAT